MWNTVKHYLAGGGILLMCHACGTSKESSTVAAPAMHWQQKQMITDGVNSEWEIPYRYGDSKAKIQYDFSNDGTHLYITMMTSDPGTQFKMLHSGMQVWIETSGKKKKDRGIAYPLENPEMPAVQAPQSNGERPDLSKRLKQQIGESTYFTLKGFTDCDGIHSIMEKEKCGIVVKMGLNAENSLIWEASVPLASLGIDPAKTKTPLDICFEINAMKRPANTTAGGNGGGMRGGGGGMRGGGMGGGMRGGGMRGGGMGGGGQVDRTQMFQATTSWQEVALAHR